MHPAIVSSWLSRPGSPWRGLLFPVWDGVAGSAAHPNISALASNAKSNSVDIYGMQSLRRYMEGCVYTSFPTHMHTYTNIFLYMHVERGRYMEGTCTEWPWCSSDGLVLLDYYRSLGQEFGHSEIFRIPYVIPRGFFLCQTAAPGILSHAAPCKSHCRSFERGTDHDTLRGEERGEKKKVLSWSYLTSASHPL